MSLVMLHAFQTFDAHAYQPHDRQGIFHGGVGYFVVQAGPLIAGLAVRQLFIGHLPKKDRWVERAVRQFHHPLESWKPFQELPVEAGEVLAGRGDGLAQPQPLSQAAKSSATWSGSRHHGSC